MKQIGNSNLYIVKESEINFKNTSSNERRSTCPVCSATREHPENTSVAWNTAAGVGFCHHCHARFKIDNKPDTFSENYGRRKPKTVEDVNFSSHLLPIDEETTQYLNDRGISVETALKAGVCSRHTWQQSFWMHWVAFPFYKGKSIVNVQYKYADVQDKRFFFENNGEMIPWNIRCIDDGKENEPLYITEGMMDALALLECGRHYVVSVPNGAGTRLSCFDAYKDKIRNRFQYLVFAGDTDDKGLELRERFVKYFGDTEVCCVEWSTVDGSAKDANDVLMHKGPGAVMTALKNAEMESSPNVSVFGDARDDLDTLYMTGIPEGKRIGLQGFDDIVHFEEGNLMLVTGYPGSGKSSLVNYICVSLFMLYGWKTVFFSPEKMPRKYHEAELISMITGKEFSMQNIEKDTYEYAKDLLKDNIMFIDEEMSEIEQIISLTQRTVRNTGAKVLVIDPFVYLTIPAIPGASETQKIADMLKKLSLATRKLNVVLLLVAHPRKPSNDMPHEPSLYEVSGSANFYNFCDAGIIMERVKGTDNVVKVTCGKARRKYNGMLGECKLAYDATCGRYVGCYHDNVHNTNDYPEFSNLVWYRGGTVKELEF